MKRLCATVITILLILLCGCKSSSEFFSDFSEIFGSDISKTYSNISSIVSGAVSKVVEESSIDESEIISITPTEINIKDAKLKAYKKLNAKQRKLYSIMLTAVNSMVLKDIEVTDYVSDNFFSDAIVVLRAVLCDRPDIFWMPKKISVLTIKGKTNRYIAFKDYNAKNDNKGFYGITKAEKEQMSKRFDTVVNSVVSAASSLGNSFEKELYLHDYLCEHVTYDQEAADDNSNCNRNAITAYGALVEGKAICEGYSKAMQLLSLKCGIPCSVVLGEHEGVSHMWNIVNPGDGLYYLDTTFDDAVKDHTLHIYFNVTKETLKKDHIFGEEFSTSKIYDGSESFNFFVDDCNSTFSNYYERIGAYIEEDCALAINTISEAISDGKNSAELKNATDRSLKSAFYHLCRKARKTVELQYCYRYDSDNVIIVTW